MCCQPVACAVAAALGRAQGTTAARMVYHHCPNLSIHKEEGCAQPADIRRYIQLGYGWIAHQMYIETSLAFLLSSSDFKSETSFGIPGPKYTRQSAYFIFL